MRFLIDASLPRDSAIPLRNAGHEALDVRDIGLRHADDSEIAAYARQNKIALISADFDFADIRIYPPVDYCGLVVIDRPDDATIAEVLMIIEQFLSQTDLLASLVGRLVIVDKTRIRTRPAF